MTEVTPENQTHQLFTPAPAPESTPGAPFSPTDHNQIVNRPKNNWTPMIVVLAISLLIILALVFILIRRSQNTVTPPPSDTNSPSSAPVSSYTPAVQLERGQLTGTERGQTTPPPEATTNPDSPGTLITQSQETQINLITDLGPGAILFGDYAFTTFNGQIIKIPLSCTSSCTHQLTINLQTYAVPGVNTPRNVNIPLVQGVIAGSNQVMLYENAEHERIIADVVFSLLENRRSSEKTYRTSYNFGTLTQQGLYLFVDNAPIKDRDSDEMIDTVTGYLMVAGNSVPAALYERFAPSVAYAGHLEVGEPIELFCESTYREDIGAYVHKLYAYFPEQNVIQAIFNEQTLLGITSKNQLVLYYPRTSISSPQIGLVSINPVLHGITGNQILIMPADMPSEEIPDYADENFYFVTADMKVYHSTVSQPLPQMVYDFAGNFRAHGYSLTNWWYTRANNNHPGVCLCSQDQVQKYNTGAFYDFQLGQFIESSPDCIGRPEVGTWYCS